MRLMQIPKVDATTIQFLLKQAKSTKLKLDVLIWTVYTGAADTTIRTVYSSYGLIKIFWQHDNLERRSCGKTQLLVRNSPCKSFVPCVIRKKRTPVLANCSFAKEAWACMRQWTSGSVKATCATVVIEGWWKESLQTLAKIQRICMAARLMYTIWNLWKEKNPRIFKGKQASHFQVFNFVREEGWTWDATESL